MDCMTAEGRFTSLVVSALCSIVHITYLNDATTRAFMHRPSGLFHPDVCASGGAAGWASPIVKSGMKMCESGPMPRA